MKKIMTLTAIALFSLAPAASAKPFFGSSESCMIQKVEQGGTGNKVEQGGTGNKVEQGGTGNKILECQGLLSVFDWF